MTPCKTAFASDASSRRWRSALKEGVSSTSFHHCCRFWANWENWIFRVFGCWGRRGRGEVRWSWRRQSAVRGAATKKKEINLPATRLFFGKLKKLKIYDKEQWFKMRFRLDREKSRSISRLKRSSANSKTFPMRPFRRGSATFWIIDKEDKSQQPNKNYLISTKWQTLVIPVFGACS